MKIKSLLVFAIIVSGLVEFRSHLICAEKTDDFTTLINQAAKYQSGDSVEPLKKIEEFVKEALSKPEKKSVVEKTLAAILAKDSTIEARKFACQQLALIGPEMSLTILSQIASLEPTTGVACMAIVNSPSTNALEALLIAFNQGNSYVKLQSVNSIGNLNWQQLIPVSDKAVSFLEERLVEKDKQLIESAIISLGKIGSKSATKVLMNLRKHKWDELSEPISDGLLRCAEKALVEGRINDARTIYSDLFTVSKVGSQIKRAALLGLLKTDNDGGLKRIEDILLGTDSSLKPVVISILPSIKKQGVSGKVSELFTKVEKNEQILIIDALADIGDSAAIKTIEKAIDSQDKDVRLVAISAIGKVGSSKHVPVLVKALNEATEPSVSQVIEQALYSLKGAATDELILKELKSSPARTRIINVLAKRFALREDSKLFHTDGFRTFLDIAQSDDQAAARAAFRALGKLCSDKEIHLLLDALAKVKSAQVRSEAENAIASVIERTQLRNVCEKLLCEHITKATTSEIKISFINLLPICGGPEALAAARIAFASKDANIKEAGLRALAEWRDMSVWDVLAGIYEKPDSEAFRVLALRGLVRLLNDENIRADEKLVDNYRRLLDGAQTASDKKLIIGALGNCAHREALYLALEKVSDPEARAEAIEAVKRIAGAIKSKYPKEVNQALEKIR